MIPGRALHRLAARICSRKTLEHVVEPAIADLQNEYGQRPVGVGRAWTLTTGYAAILEVIVMCAFSASIKTDDERQAVVRTLAWSLVLVIAITALLMLPPLTLVYGSLSASFLASVIPQAVPLAIPIGLTFGIAIGMTRRTATRGITRSILLSAIVGSLVSFATLAWVMPVSNQWFRESLAERNAGVEIHLTKGPNEMTFSELDRQAAIAAAAGDGIRSGTYTWSFHLRFALSVASIVLAGLLLATSVVFRARILVALLACVAYWALIYAGEELAIYSSGPGYHRAGTIPIIVGAWLPNIVLTAAALFASSSAPRLRDRDAAVDDYQ